MTLQMNSKDIIIYHFPVILFILLILLILLMIYDRLTGLAIGENAGVVPLERIVQNIATQGVEHHILIREILRGRVQGIETVIERERFWFAPVTIYKKKKSYLLARFILNILKLLNIKQLKWNISRSAIFSKLFICHGDNFFYKSQYFIRIVIFPLPING